MKKKDAIASDSKELTDGSKSLVRRTDVPPALPYKKYKEYLRRDFFASCAYCTMSEAEASAVRMTIDHYEPRSSYPALENEYNNLMYSCDTCNQLKGDRCPPPAAREDGIRFFRPDEDVRQDHFEGNGLRLKEKTNVGGYSIEALDLNRAALRRLRELRKRLYDTDKMITEGIMGLRSLPIDQFPLDMRGQILRMRKDIEIYDEQISRKIDDILFDNAKSLNIEPTDDFDPSKLERKQHLKDIEALYPGQWRGLRGKHP